MIKIKCDDIDDKTFDSSVDVRGSSKEIIRDFYCLHDLLMKDLRVATLYGVAIRKWEQENENN